VQNVFNRLGWVLAAVVSLVALAAVAGIVRAGPLDPPAAPGSTAGVLRPGTPITSLPYTINQPGNYYLTGNLTMPTSGVGITINANDVTLDLGGFMLEGNGVGNEAVYFAPQFGGDLWHSITVRNGGAHGWTQYGFELDGANAIIAEDLQAYGNNVGIIVKNGTLTNCSADFNTNVGVEAFGGVTVSNCEAKNNSVTGFALTNGSALHDCTAYGNPVGIDVRASIVDGCAVYGGNYGITVAFNSNVRNNSVTQTGSDGIRVASVSGSGESTITENTVESAGSNGLASGIYVQTQNNEISRNHVTETNGPGIQVVGTFNTVDENTTLTNTGIGIVVGGSKNTIIHNISLGNVNQGSSTNYSIDAANNAGPIGAASTSTSPFTNTQ
jgi:Periplasmic copper-binding protein (NosD)